MNLASSYPGPHGGRSVESKQEAPKGPFGRVVFLWNIVENHVGLSPRREEPDVGNAGDLGASTSAPPEELRRRGAAP